MTEPNSTEGAGGPAAVAAATILLVRDHPTFQVLMVKRHHQIDFAGGALVFPGGKTHAGDHDPAWTEHIGSPNTDPAQRALRIAAIREAYEETGILMARHAGGEHFQGSLEAAEARDEIADDSRGFLELVTSLGLRLDLEAPTVFARWITPVMMPKRFDTWFYIAHAPADQLALCDGHETVDAEWIAPAEALRLGEAGERTVIFPTRMNLKLLAEATSAADAIARATSRPLVTVLPKVVERDGARSLIIPQDAGYGAVVEPMDRVMR
jgi:8-oxo-dGTP pyrophosphatase MutT (NUDIX family)